MPVGLPIELVVTSNKHLTICHVTGAIEMENLHLLVADRLQPHTDLVCDFELGGGLGLRLRQRLEAGWTWVYG